MTPKVSFLLEILQASVVVSTIVSVSILAYVGKAPTDVLAGVLFGSIGWAGGHAAANAGIRRASDFEKPLARNPNGTQ